MPKIIDTVATDTIVELTNAHGVDVAAVNCKAGAVSATSVITGGLKLTANPGAGLCLTSDQDGNATWSDTITTSVITPSFALTASPTQGYYLMTDSGGNASLQSLYVEPTRVTVSDAGTYAILGTNPASVFLFTPDSAWTVTLPPLAAGRTYHLYNCSTEYSMTVTVANVGETIWDGVRTSVTVPPNAKISLIGGNTNMPRWFAA